MDDDWAERQEDDDIQQRLQALSVAAENDGEPLRWFEDLYASAHRDSEHIPWARMGVNPILKNELEREDLPPGRALMVGCGLGDDAVYLEKIGWEVSRPLKEGMSSTYPWIEDQVNKG